MIVCRYRNQRRSAQQPVEVQAVTGSTGFQYRHRFSASFGVTIRLVTDGGSSTGAVDRGELESRLAADVRALNAGSDRIGRVFASLHDVSNNDLDALLHVIVAETAGSPLTSGDMRERLGVSAPAITYVVDRMIASGHIRRETDPTDRRKVILRYSEHGLQVARRFFGPLGAHMHTAMSNLSDDDLLAAHRVLAAVSDAMETYRAELATHIDVSDT
jgi:DNA-binding MarR family transcriptional regulator